jgi:hypothetical protein
MGLPVEVVGYDPGPVEVLVDSWTMQDGIRGDVGKITNKDMEKLHEKSWEKLVARSCMSTLG